MKIEKIQTYILRSSLREPFYSSQARFTDRNSLLVRISTYDGIVGWSEGGQYGPPESVSSSINDVLGPDLSILLPMLPSVHLKSFIRSVEILVKKVLTLRCLAQLTFPSGILWASLLVVPFTPYSVVPFEIKLRPTVLDATTRISSPIRRKCCRPSKAKGKAQRIGPSSDQNKGGVPAD